MIALKGKRCMLVSLALFLCFLTACQQTAPTFNDLTADNGIGRDTGFDTSSVTDPPETTPPVTTDPPETTDPADAQDTAPPDDDPRITVCLDAGHGFGDGGTGSDFLGEVLEKDITLSVTMLLKEKLEAMGFRVFLTHDGKEFPLTILDDRNNLYNPRERVSYAKTLDLDLFVSIHCDSYPTDPSVRGTRIYYSTGTSFASKTASVATNIKNGINDALNDTKKAVTRGMAHEDAYYVVRENRVPSVLIEMGFVSNETDATNMLNRSWHDMLATGIANGILNYFN